MGWNEHGEWHSTRALEPEQERAYLDYLIEAGGEDYDYSRFDAQMPQERSVGLDRNFHDLVWQEDLDNYGDAEEILLVTAARAVNDGRMPWGADRVALSPDELFRRTEIKTAARAVGMKFRLQDRDTRGDLINALKQNDPNGDYDHPNNGSLLSISELWDEIARQVDREDLVRDSESAAPSGQGLDIEFDGLRGPQSRGWIVVPRNGGRKIRKFYSEQAAEDFAVEVDGAILAPDGTMYGFNQSRPEPVEPSAFSRVPADWLDGSSQDRQTGPAPDTAAGEGLNIEFDGVGAAGAKANRLVIIYDGADKDDVDNRDNCDRPLFWNDDGQSWGSFEDATVYPAGGRGGALPPDGKWYEITHLNLESCCLDRARFSALSGRVGTFNARNFDNDILQEDSVSESYGDFQDDKDGFWFEHNLVSGSDYSGGAVTRSNYQELLKACEEAAGYHHDEDFPDCCSLRWFVSLTGGHGTYSLVLHMTRTPDSIVELLEGLENYPILDEDAHTELEMEQQAEAWENWAREDYKGELQKAFGRDIDFDDCTDDDIFEHFRHWSDEAHEYWFEDGTDQYIRLAPIAKAAAKEGQLPDHARFEDDDESDDSGSPSGGSAAGGGGGLTIEFDGLGAAHGWIGEPSCRDKYNALWYSPGGNLAAVAVVCSDPNPGTSAGRQATAEFTVSMYTHRDSKDPSAGFDRAWTVVFETRDFSTPTLRGIAEVGVQWMQRAGKASSVYWDTVTELPDCKDLPSYIEESAVGPGLVISFDGLGATPTAEAHAGFDISVYGQDMIESNAEERFSTKYGDPQDRADALQAGFIDANGEITVAGWEQIGQDNEQLELNAMRWLRANFKSARDEGHGTDGALVGTVWYDPDDSGQVELILLASPGNERIDMNDRSYGDLAYTAFDSVSSFGKMLLGGQITFFDVDAGAGSAATAESPIGPGLDISFDGLGASTPRPVEDPARYQYLNVISPGPLVIARVPLVGAAPGKHPIVWRKLLKAVNAILREHGLRAKDLSAVENLNHPEEWREGSERAREQARQLSEKLARAYAGDTALFEPFWLYAWDGTKFSVVRPPVGSGTSGLGATPTPVEDPSDIEVAWQKWAARDYKQELEEAFDLELDYGYSIDLDNVTDEDLREHLQRHAKAVRQDWWFDRSRVADSDHAWRTGWVIDLEAIAKDAAEDRDLPRGGKFNVDPESGEPPDDDDDGSDSGGSAPPKRQGGLDIEFDGVGATPKKAFVEATQTEHLRLEARAGDFWLRVVDDGELFNDPGYAPGVMDALREAWDAKDYFYVELLEHGQQIESVGSMAGYGGPAYAACSALNDFGWADHLTAEALQDLNDQLGCVGILRRRGEDAQAAGSPTPETGEGLNIEFDGTPRRKRMLYRAAKDDYVDTGYSFSESIDVARVYLDNPGFGGEQLYVAEISPADTQVIDLTDLDTAEVASFLGEPDPGAIGVDEWIPRTPQAIDALRAQGYCWAIVRESYPSGERTWIWLGTAVDDEPELRPVSRRKRRRKKKR